MRTPSVRDIPRTLSVLRKILVSVGLRNPALLKGSSYYVPFLSLLLCKRDYIRIDHPLVGQMILDMEDRGSVNYFIGLSSETDQTNYGLMQSLSRRFDAAFDIGAHVGLISRLLLSSNEKMKVYSFEPNKEVLPLLALNLNEFGGRAHIVGKGVYSMQGSLPFHAHSASSLSSLSAEENIPGVRVDVVSLDQFVGDEDGLVIDLIKIDTEGMELHALEGGKNLIKRSSPLIFVENNCAIWNAKGRSLEEFMRRDAPSYSIYYFSHSLGEVIRHEEGNDLRRTSNNLWLVPAKWESTFQEEIKAISKCRGR